MNRAYVERWIESLRSGKYAQGDPNGGLLDNHGRYSALGVACQIAMDRGLIRDWLKDTNGFVACNNDDRLGIYCDSHLLPSSVADHIGCSVRGAFPVTELSDWDIQPRWSFVLPDGTTPDSVEAIQDRLTFREIANAMQDMLKRMDGVQLLHGSGTLSADSDRESR